jgi:hypothetical protein
MWNNGLYSGMGRYIHGKGVSSGAFYEGMWVLGKKSGVGVYTWPDGAQYKGEYFEGKKHGKGTYIYASGD